jgi:hypothetical protein
MYSKQITNPVEENYSPAVNPKISTRKGADLNMWWNLFKWQEGSNFWLTVFSILWIKGKSRRNIMKTQEVELVQKSFATGLEVNMRCLVALEPENVANPDGNKH